MDYVSPILDIVTRVWDCTAKHGAYMKDLQDNMESLRNATDVMKNVRDDVKRRVEVEEQRQKRRRNEVSGWLDRVQVVETEVISEVLQKGEEEIQKKCIGGGTCCPRNCRSSYKLGKKAIKMLRVVADLTDEGRSFVVVADSVPEDPVAERPMENTVGLDPMYEEVCRCIQDEKLGIIGLYGMGGAGKTTLMTKVNNEFILRGASKGDFDIAIWVVVSRPASVEKVQQVILNKLGQFIPEDRLRNTSTEDEKKELIFNVLKTKRFVLLLDDVWERVDLQMVGVPISPNGSTNKSKVIFTTRSLDVCRRLGAQKCMKVVCLREEEAFDLFKEKVGETTLNSHPDIPRLAEIAARECQGLPLALVTIGRAMAGKNTPQQWERAIQTLKEYPSKFPGMGDEVFPVLKFSYDNLPSLTIKDCFLYLAIFPEDYKIQSKELIMLWIGEGFLEDGDNMEEAIKEGYEIIEHLKTACLFEEGGSGVRYDVIRIHDVSDDSYAEDTVKMHDVIHDMALWLVTADTRNRNKDLLQAVDSSNTSTTRIEILHQSSKWKDVQMKYCLSSELEVMMSKPLPNLVTLLVQRDTTRIREFPSGFFQFMSGIKVFDLHDCGIRKLPIEIGNLVKLEYLNLSGTLLQRLPEELTTLENLRCLLLRRMYYLEVIPEGVISNLSMMRIFTLYRSSYHKSRKGDDERIVDELEGLEHLNYVELGIIGALGFNKLLSSCQKLKNAMRRLWLQGLEDVTSLQLPKEMKLLQELTIIQCRELEEIRVDDQIREGGHDIIYMPNSNFYSHLRRITIQGLHKLVDLRWLIYIPGVEWLKVRDCHSMEEVVVIVGDHQHHLPADHLIFSRLKRLILDNLPKLRRIINGGRVLPFPSLIQLEVWTCPKLSKLPLDLNSARNSLKRIKGDSNWWEGLEWEGETIRLHFTPYYSRF